MGRQPLPVVRGLLIAAAVLGTAVVLHGVLAQESGSLLTTDMTVTIAYGDTLDEIGAFYDVDVDCIFSANNLRASDILYPGDQIILSPSCPPYDGAAPVANPRPLEGYDPSGNLVVYVRSGDTLDTLAQRYNVSLDALLVANSLTRTSFSRSGDRLAVPAGSPPYGYVAAPEVPDLSSGQGGGASVYIVQYGDNLDLIASYFNVKLSCLLEANALTVGSVIVPLQVLSIPGGCPPYDGFSSNAGAYLNGLQVTQVFYQGQSFVGEGPVPTALLLAPLPSPTAEAFAQEAATPTPEPPAPTASLIPTSISFDFSASATAIAEQFQQTPSSTPLG